MSGKGHRQRSVNKDVFDENYEGIFGPWVASPRRAKKRVKKRRRKNEKNLEQN